MSDTELIRRYRLGDQTAFQQLAARYFLIIYLPMLPRAASAIFGTVLRAAGDTKTPMRIGLCVNGLNVLLNFLLIYPSTMAESISRER